MKINEQLNDLFHKWDKLYKENANKKGFCEDGLINRDGNEEELWNDAPKRILFLLKDVNARGADEYDDDIRLWSPGKKDRVHKHYKMIAYWLFGLLSFDEKNNAPDFNSIDFGDDVLPIFNKAPHSIVNCKKEVGGATISDSILREHISIYGNFIKEEIEILNPDIIVCGGGNGIIKDFVINDIYNAKKIDENNNWIYYDEINNKVIIDSWHPSARKSYEDVYYKMMEAYKEFLEKHPDFRKSSRKNSNC